MLEHTQFFLIDFVKLNTGRLFSSMPVTLLICSLLADSRAKRVCNLWVSRRYYATAGCVKRLSLCGLFVERYICRCWYCCRCCSCGYRIRVTASAHLRDWAIYTYVVVLTTLAIMYFTICLFFVFAFALSRLCALQWTGSATSIFIKFFKKFIFVNCVFSK